MRTAQLGDANTAKKRAEKMALAPSLYNANSTHRFRGYAPPTANGKELLERACDWGIEGDMNAAGSPNDIAFWPTHPTVDRLYAWRRLNGLNSSAAN